MWKTIRFWFLESRYRIREAIPRKMAYYMPRQVVYWCIIRVWAQATTGKWGKEEPTKVLVKTALDRWKETSQTPQI